MIMHLLSFRMAICFVLLLVVVVIFSISSSLLLVHVSRLVLLELSQISNTVS